MSIWYLITIPYVICTFEKGSPIKILFLSSPQSLVSSLLIMTVSCYICSNTYSMKSITTHIPNCMARWEEKQFKLPYNQRLPLPLPPKGLAKVMLGELSGKELDEFNTAGLKECNRATLADCKYCKRWVMGWIN